MASVSLSTFVSNLLAEGKSPQEVTDALTAIVDDQKSKLSTLDADRVLGAQRTFEDVRLLMPTLAEKGASITKLSRAVLNAKTSSAAPAAPVAAAASSAAPSTPIVAPSKLVSNVLKHFEHRFVEGKSLVIADLLNTHKEELLDLYRSMNPRKDNHKQAKQAVFAEAKRLLMEKGYLHS